jgi:hypothetical protein
MNERWTPPLRLHEKDGCCRLSLVGVTYGKGPTLQEAGDDLVARLVRLVTAVRESGLRQPAELGPADLRVLDFLYELGRISGSGGDLRDRVFGSSGDADVAA